MIKKLASSIREYKWLAMLTPLLMVGEVYFEIMIPYYMADLIDLGIEAGNMAEIRSIGLRLAVMALCSMMCGTLAAVTASKASAGFASNLRSDIFHRVQDFSFSNIDHISASGLVTRMTTDVTNVQMAFSMLLRMAFRAPATLIFAGIMVFRINHSLASVIFYVLPVLAIGILLISKGAFKWFRRMFDIYDKLNSVVQENVRGIKVVKAFVREKDEIEKFSGVAGDLYTTNMRAETIMAFMSPLMNICLYGCMLIISWLGAKLIVSGSLTTGLLMSFINYVMQILMSLMMLSGIMVMMTMSGAAAKRISEVFGEQPEIVNGADPVREMADSSIVFENVSFAYGDGGNCLEDISFRIEAGMTVGIIGGTGSGKTSLVQLIPRLYDAGSGRVLVGGTDVRDYDLNVLRKNVSMVLQKNILFSGSVADNLRWGKEDATEEEMWRALEMAQAKDFISSFEGGLDYWIEQGGSNVSGGQRQRLCIARALISEPKILILDDSTSAVDTHTESLIRKAFREEMPELTKLIIAQRISSVQDADMIIVLDNGRISGMGRHDELLETNEIYREVYESQTKGGDFDEPS